MDFKDEPRKSEWKMKKKRNPHLLFLRHEVRDSILNLPDLVVHFLVLLLDYREVRNRLLWG